MSQGHMYDRCILESRFDRWFVFTPTPRMDARGHVWLIRFERVIKAYLPNG